MEPKHNPSKAWNRRVLLKTSGLALLSLGAGPSFLDRLALQTSNSSRPRVLVTIFQRGAMDGLMAVSPVDDPHLRLHRPHLSMKATRSGDLHDLDGRFALHPAFEGLLPLWSENRLAIVHGVGSPTATRSHFDAQDYMETARPGYQGKSNGWLNRVADHLGANGSPFQALAISPDLPRALAGRLPALAIEDLSRFRLLLPTNDRLADRLGHDLELLYRQRPGLLGTKVREMFGAMGRISQDAYERYRRQRVDVYPETQLGRSLLQIAFLIKAGVGLEIACADSNGWDTHIGQGTTQGAFATRARDLAQSLSAFWSDLGSQHQEDVVVLTMTEFGRTVAENGTGGTDHGHGSCSFVLGNRVDGGKVHGEVPELAPDNLYDGRDLPVTTDFRSVFAGVAGSHFQIEKAERLFPGWQGERLPLLT